MKQQSSAGAEVYTLGKFSFNKFMCTAHLCFQHEFHFAKAMMWILVL